MTHPYELGPQTEPHPTDYKPRSLAKSATAAAVTATQELLDFMRFRGYGAASVTVGPQGVQIVGLTDMYPRKPPVAKAPTEADLFDDDRMQR